MIWTNFNSYTDPTPSDMLMILSLDQHAAYVTMGRPLRSISVAFVLISEKGDSTAAARQDFQALDVKLVSSDLLSITILDKIIPPVPFARELGVYIDERVSHNTHIYCINTNSSSLSLTKCAALRWANRRIVDGTIRIIEGHGNKTR